MAGTTRSLLTRRFRLAGRAIISAVFGLQGDPMLRSEAPSAGTGVTREVSRAMSMFAERAAEKFGARLLKIALFGSRARGEARRESDIDLAVVMRDTRDVDGARRDLSDISYDVLIETGEEVQAWLVPASEWTNPHLACNPVLIMAMKRDGIDVYPDHGIGDQADRDYAAKMCGRARLAAYERIIDARQRPDHHPETNDRLDSEEATEAEAVRLCRL